MESGVQPQRMGLSPEDRDALQAYIDEYVSQCLDRDWDALVERLTDDVVLLPPDESAVIGEAAAAVFLRPFLSLRCSVPSSRVPTDAQTLPPCGARSI